MVWYVIDTETGKKKRFPSELDCAFFIAMVQDFFPNIGAHTLTYFKED